MKMPNMKYSHEKLIRYGLETHIESDIFLCIVESETCAHFSPNWTKSRSKQKTLSKDAKRNKSLSNTTETVAIIGETSFLENGT